MINGTFIQVHQTEQDPPNYYNNLEFADTLDLGNLFIRHEPGIPASYYTGEKHGDQKTETVSNKIAEKGVSGKLFLVESNSAHNISYFLASCAFKEQGLTNGSKFLVINYDQHEDYEGMSNDMLLCSNWGYYICQELKCDYLVIGRYKGHNKLWNPLRIKYDETAGKIRESCEFTNVNTTINNYNQIYVTVDMDVLTGNDNDPRRTNWRHGEVALNTLCDEWLAALPSNKIIAADITGFPPISNPGDAESPVMAQYMSDIETVAQKLCQVLKIAP